MVSATDGARWPRKSPEDDAAVDLTGERIGPYRIVPQASDAAAWAKCVSSPSVPTSNFQQRVAIKLCPARGCCREHVPGPAEARNARSWRRSIIRTIARLFDGGTTTDGTPYIVHGVSSTASRSTPFATRALPRPSRSALRLFSRSCAPQLLSRGTRT
jgi:hypothetical protein